MTAGLQRALALGLLGLALALAAGRAGAERADRQKPVNVESDRMNADDLKEVAVFIGRVVITQGTFTLCADQVTVRQDQEGNQSGTALGNPARFREKRDGADEWIVGEAQRIDYDNKNSIVELFVRAKVDREKDEVRGNFISYDAKTEFIKVQNEKDQSGTATLKEQRVNAVFQPKPKPQPAGAAKTPAARTADGAPSALQGESTLGPPPSRAVSAPVFCSR
jgi:lipopolysaccharide export system protein LptA